MAVPRPGARPGESRGRLDVPCSQNRVRDGRFADLGLTERSRSARRDLPRAHESGTAAPLANLSKAHSKAKTARVCDTGKQPF